ncbi:MAG: hypothetical protein MI757_08855, partial [Pirellulales bacterium]|nr:hypothetical protein [Pirellulales bacterium]
DQFANKAGFEEVKQSSSDDEAKPAETPNAKLFSYGSATCDGLRSLAYLKVSEDNEEPAKAAELWLIRNDTVETVPGFKTQTDRNWHQSLYYYYLMSLAKAYRLYPQTGTLTRRRLLADQLVGLQKPDGSWVNKASGMREDDPLIATSFALIAIAEAAADEP